MLGLIDVGSCAMFANLKVHGGSNHLVLPTGLLQRHLADVQPWHHGHLPDGGSCTGDAATAAHRPSPDGPFRTTASSFFSDFAGGHGQD